MNYVQELRNLKDKTHAIGWKCILMDTTHGARRQEISGSNTPSNIYHYRPGCACSCASMGGSIMRLWSLHPLYLDNKGLGGLWNECLGAQRVILGQQRMHRNHPQLIRFLEPRDVPILELLGSYLTVVHEEAVRRGLKYDFSLIVEPEDWMRVIPVTREQVNFELGHLSRKLEKRASDRRGSLPRAGSLALIHPLFFLVDGPVEAWERTEGSKEGK